MESKSIEIWKDPAGRARTEERFLKLGSVTVVMGLCTGIALLGGLTTFIMNGSQLSGWQAWVLTGIMTAFAVLFVAFYASFLSAWWKLINWPMAHGMFGPKNKSVHDVDGIGDGISWGEPPDVINIFDPSHDDVVTSLLEAARLQGQSLKPGESFAVAAPREQFRNVHPHQIIGAVMMRAGDYGLAPGMCTDMEFQFIKL